VEHITRGGAHQFVLLDSIREDGSGKSGGTGKVIDWELAKKVVDAGEIVPGSFGKTKGITPVATNDSEDTPDHAEPDVTVPTINGIEHNINPPNESLSFPLPIILAGGLNPNNVDVAIAQVRPWAVDVSGGVENEDGTAKDLEKVAAFIDAAKDIKRAIKNEEDEKDS
jgi:anthranilate synthase/indole-3-glycerol phosphate synthase/phosphoribosylanthranilate isomerase